MLGKTTGLSLSCHLRNVGWLCIALSAGVLTLRFFGCVLVAVHCSLYKASVSPWCGWSVLGERLYISGHAAHPEAPLVPNTTGNALRKHHVSRNEGRESSWVSDCTAPLGVNPGDSSSSYLVGLVWGLHELISRKALKTVPCTRETFSKCSLLLIDELVSGEPRTN